MRFAFLLPAVSLLLGTLCGCSTKQRPPAANQPLTATDDLGRTVILHSAPRRVVSLAPSITETLFALGLDSSIIGVTDYCDFPEAAKRCTKVGGIANPNLEQIVDLRPDLIVMSVSGNIRSDFERLIGLGLQVFVTNPRDLAGIFKSIHDLGVITARKAEAESLVVQIHLQQEAIAGIAKREPEKSVLFLLSLRPLISCGKGTFVDELLTMANATNLAHASLTAYPILSREEVVRLQPQVIVVTSDVARSVSDIVNAYPEWKTLAAIRGQRVAIIDANLVTRPGPRIILGLQALAGAIHQ